MIYINHCAQCLAHNKDLVNVCQAIAISCQRMLLYIFFFEAQLVYAEQLSLLAFSLKYYLCTEKKSLKKIRR